MLLAKKNFYHKNISVNFFFECCLFYLLPWQWLKNEVQKTFQKSEYGAEVQGTLEPHDWVTE